LLRTERILAFRKKLTSENSNAEKADNIVVHIPLGFVISQY